MKTLFAILLIGSKSLFAIIPAYMNPTYDDLQGMELLRALIRDQKYEDADKILEEQALSSGDKSYFRGVMALRSNNFKLAQDQLESSLIETNQRKTSREEILVQLAEAYFQANQMGKCASAFLQAGPKSLITESNYLLRSECERRSQNAERAWDTQYLAENRLKLTFPLLREKLVVLLELKLVEQALSVAVRWLEKTSTASEWLAIIEVLQRYKLNEEASSLLEMARVLSKDPDVQLTAAANYHQNGWKLATAEAFERANLGRPEFGYHASEIKRNIGYKHASYWWHLQGKESSQRLKQKIAYSVNAENWSLLTSISAAVSREKLAEDDEVNYALGYALYRYFDYSKGDSFLDKVRGAGILPKVAHLKQAGFSTK